MKIYDSGIYRITNLINRKFYIGSASNENGLEGRWKRHKKDLRMNKHSNSHLQRAYNKYGEENFTFEIITVCDPENCLRFEQKCLDVYKPWDREIGYNVAKDALAPFRGLKHSTEHIEKITGAGNPFKNKKHSQKTNEKNRIWHLGRKIKYLSEESKKRKSCSSGESNINVKLTWKKVQEIRNLYLKAVNKRGILTELSKLFKVSSSTISYIIKNKTWKIK